MNTSDADRFSRPLQATIPEIMNKINDLVKNDRGSGIFVHENTLIKLGNASAHSEPKRS